MAGAGAPVPADRDEATELAPFGFTLLAPLGALVCLVAFLPLAGLWLGGRRLTRAAAAVGLAPPAAYSRAMRALVLVAACCALGLAVAQPALRRDGGRQARTDVQVLFVVDVSRSMLASTGAGKPTRIERARAVATELRAAIPQAPAGVASLTDRVLPHLFPTPDAAAFGSTLVEAVEIEAPPPQQAARVATSFSALAALGSSGFFRPGVRRRVCVLLTDGETARRAGPPRGCRFVVVQFWGSAERIFRDGAAEPQYRPDDAAPALAAAIGPMAGEHDLGRARSLLGTAVGSGPVHPLAGGGRGPLRLGAAFGLAGLALVLLALLGPLRLPGVAPARTMTRA